jgi:mono/diheme cytochrome c family protein
MRIWQLALFGIMPAATPMAQAPSPSTAPTFYKDVLPILQKNCQTCHRPGEVAPMSLLTFDDAWPWARAIKAAVTARTMPPWFADPDYGHFDNERRLATREIEVITFACLH